MLVKYSGWATLALLAIVRLPASAGVHVDYDKALDFSQYRTYSWGEGTEAEPEFVERRIEAAIDRELASLGLQKVEGPADLQVVTHASVEIEKRIDIDSFPYWERWHRGSRWASSVVYVQDVEVGTLIIDLIAGDSGELAWRAIASGAVGNPEKNEKRINKAVKKMFKRFPPE